MNSRLELDRGGAPQTSWSTNASDRWSPGTPLPARPPTGGRPNLATPPLTVEDRHSCDPMRATDRYRLVMPYSLRV